jgi:hypothetical protein
MKTAAVLLVLLWPLLAVAQDSNPKADADQWEECKTILIPACERYLSAFSSDKERSSWNRKIDGRIEQRVKDNNSDPDSSFQSIALDWASDNRGKIEKKEREAIKCACMLFVRFSKSGIPPPSQVRNELTASNAKELADWLNDSAETHEMVEKNKGKAR